ncbi:HAD-IA family hydrolase [Modestobacter roseus]|uniref:HAD-IA family hydrolase n=1 Tax=Modestobacter roseus TaxID=1181884 RepID=UPI0034DF791E
MPEPTAAPSLDLAALTGRTFDAVLFDMDGTLIDSMSGALAAWDTWAHEHGVDPAVLTELGMGGRPAVQVIGQLLAADRVADAVARIEQLEIDAAATGIAVLPGTADALAALPSERVAIVTSCTRTLLAARLAGSGLPRPREIVTFDDVEHGKPAPDPFLLGARRLGFDPARCLAVEDAPAGLASAGAAGCTTLAVGDTHPHHELDADAHAPDLSHLRFAVTPDGITVTGRVQTVQRGSRDTAASASNTSKAAFS